jgi:hypothetical protein
MDEYNILDEILLFLNLDSDISSDYTLSDSNDPSLFFVQPTEKDNTNIQSLIQLVNDSTNLICHDLSESQISTLLITIRRYYFQFPENHETFFQSFLLLISMTNFTSDRFDDDIFFFKSLFKSSFNNQIYGALILIRISEVNDQYIACSIHAASILFHF